MTGTTTSHSASGRILYFHERFSMSLTSPVPATIASKAKTAVTLDECAPGIIRDTSKCILCGRCIERCKEAQGSSLRHDSIILIFVTLFHMICP